mmetsp:Transcript_1120/g.2451  ORF Transcript_1120/g.2451 Transcript_1120/m.2451 type:complete len:353 (-) Transcript_1120:41-1099(-)
MRLGNFREVEARAPVEHPFERKDMRALHHGEGSLHGNDVGTDSQAQESSFPQTPLLTEDGVGHDPRLEQEEGRQGVPLKPPRNSSGDDMGDEGRDRTGVRHGQEDALGDGVCHAEDAPLSDTLHDPPGQEPVPYSDDALLRRDAAEQLEVRLRSVRRLHENLEELDDVPDGDFEHEGHQDRHEHLPGGDRGRGGGATVDGEGRERGRSQGRGRAQGRGAVGGRPCRRMGDGAPSARRVRRGPASSSARCVVVVVDEGDGHRGGRCDVLQCGPKIGGGAAHPPVAVVLVLVLVLFVKFDEGGIPVWCRYRPDFPLVQGCAQGGAAWRRTVRSSRTHPQRGQAGSQPSNCQEGG